MSGRTLYFAGKQFLEGAEMITQRKHAAWVPVFFKGGPDPIEKRLAEVLKSQHEVGPLWATLVVRNSDGTPSIGLVAEPQDGEDYLDAIIRCLREIGITVSKEKLPYAWGSRDTKVMLPCGSTRNFFIITITIDQRIVENVTIGGEWVESKSFVLGGFPEHMRELWRRGSTMGGGNDGRLFPLPFIKCPPPSISVGSVCVLRRW